jgi:DNA primase
MRISDDIIAAVRDAADIVDVVGDYVRLKKRSSNFVGLCPFHAEKTPSFNVNPRLGIYKCFGCGEGGDVFAFVSRMETVSFPEAVRSLAERLGIPIPEEGADPAEDSERESIHHALQFAARFFHEQLTHPDSGEVARAYLAGREVAPEMVRHFGIGYAPDAWDGLLTEATQAGLDVTFLEKAGLVLPRRDGSGYYDRYRHRLIFPIFSHVGKVLGFGGRILEKADDQPKYINSPETLVYHKSRVLYGLYQAKRDIRGKEEAILVEGYTDVVALHQAGVRHVVASSGTALTTEQVQLLARYAKRVLLLYDADAAGQKATVRGIQLLLAAGLAPFIVRLPDGEDPDSYVRVNGAEAFVEFVRRERLDFVAYLHGRARQSGALDAPDTRAAAQKAIMRIVGAIPDPLVREAYVQEAASIMDMPESMLRQAMAGRRREAPRNRDSADERSARPKPAAVVPVDRPVDVAEPLPEEKTLLRLMMERGREMVSFIMSRTTFGEFSEGPAREAAGILVRQFEAGEVSAEPLVAGRHGDAVQRLVTEILTDTDEPSEHWKHRKIPVPGLNEDPEAAAAGAMTLLKLDRIDQMIEDLKQQLRELENQGSDVRPLQEELVGLQKHRKRIEDREFLR